MYRFFLIFLLSVALNARSVSKTGDNNPVRGKKKTTLKTFLKKHHIPVYSRINSTNIRVLNALFNSLYSERWKDSDIEEKDSIQLRNLCFFATTLFYSTGAKNIFSLENYYKMKKANTLQARIFRCIFSDVNLGKYPVVNYRLNKNISYNIELFGTKPEYGKRDSIIPAKLLAQSLKNTATGIKKDMSKKEILAANVKSAFKNDRLTNKAIDSVLTNDTKTLGGALLFIGLREGLTEEQKRNLASKMTELATKLNMRPVKEAVDAYINSNVRIYVDNGNNFLVNYKLEF